MRYILILVLLSWSVLSVAQRAQSLLGTVKNSKTKELLLSATVGLTDADGKISYTTTDTSGVYKFSSIKLGNYVLQISYIGYKNWQKTISMSPSEDKSIDVLMEDVKAVSVKVCTMRAE